MKVSSKSENPMLRTVKVLRRLLRKAFFLTKRVRVMSELQENARARTRLRRGPRLRIADALGPDNRPLRHHPLCAFHLSIRSRREKGYGDGRMVRALFVHPSAYLAWGQPPSVARRSEAPQSAPTL